MHHGIRVTLLCTLFFTLLSAIASQAGTWTVDLVWDIPAIQSGDLPLSDITGYRLERSQATSMIDPVFFASPPTALTAKNIVTGVGQWCYWVRTLYSTAISVPSNQVCIQVPAAPEITGVTLKSGVVSNKVTLEIAWKQPTGPGNAVTGYQLSRATSSSGPWALVGATGGALTLQDAVAIDTMNCYQVNAIWSTTIDGTFTALSDPAAHWCVRVGLHPPRQLRLGLSAPSPTP